LLNLGQPLIDLGQALGLLVAGGGDFPDQIGGLGGSGNDLFQGFGGFMEDFRPVGDFFGNFSKTPGKIVFSVIS
jgi:hypothetical protein